MKITDEMVEALRDVIRHKLAMWDASTRLENLCSVEINTSGHVIDNIAAGVNDLADIDERDVKDVLEESRKYGPLT